MVKIKKSLCIPRLKSRGLFGTFGCSEMQHPKGCGFNPISDITKDNILKGNKGQFKIQQMTFMIAAVFLFFVLAGLFLISVQFKNLRKQADVIAKNQAMMLAEFLAESPEFRCGGSLGSYCVDTDKILFMMNRQAYKEFWPAAYIRIYKAYPQSTVACTRENYPDCGFFEIFNSGASSTTSVSSFVALCRKEKTEVIRDVCELGRFVVGYKLR